jgi:ribose 1,5-bisphosphokinase
MTGRLWFVVGPSGAGKDTVLAGLAASLTPQDGVMIARRIITRPCQPGGAEQHLSVTDDGFSRLEAAGAFALSWASHGLRYGIGAEVRLWLAAGMQVVANGSRAAIPAARAAFGPALRVVEITAPPELLAARLAARGRESAADIAARLDRTGALAPTGADLVIVNDTTPETAVQKLRAAILAGVCTCV